MCEWHRSAEIRKQKQAQKLLLPKPLLENLFNELFPTLSYYCPTKMGEPLLSPHFSWSWIGWIDTGQNGSHHKWNFINTAND